MLRRRNVVVVALALVFALLSGAACSRNKLSRDRAAEVIKPQVSSEMVVAVLDGEQYDQLMNKSYVDPLVEKGILRLLKKERPSPMAILLPGRKETVSVIQLTDIAKPFVTKVRDTGGVRTVLVLANRAFQEVTGISESDNGKSAEVEFTWFWKPTAAGERLEGVTLNAPGLVRPIAVVVKLSGAFSHKVKAQCSLYDDGWRCESGVPRDEDILNDSF